MKYYRNCTELKKDYSIGFRDYSIGFREGHLFYRLKFDRDKDEFACER